MLRRRPANNEFVSSGSTLLDLVLGGVDHPGWARGRIANLVGDSSAGKSLIAIETCANVARLSDAEHVRYAESEHAYDPALARLLGMPPDVDPTEINTVEEFHDDLQEFLKKQKRNTPSIYVLDSLDALADEAELERDIRKGSYGTAKAKLMSEMLRRLIPDIEKSGTLLLVVSQIRDKIGVTFGETKMRVGGHALNFYSSQVIWLHEIQKINREVSGAKRATGIRIKAKNKKNKVAIPFRDAEMTLTFMYGIDDELSMLQWMKDNKAPLNGVVPTSMWKMLVTARSEGDRATAQTIHTKLREIVLEHWADIEKSLEPPMRKYV